MKHAAIGMMLGGSLALSACAGANQSVQLDKPAAPQMAQAEEAAQFAADRQAILAMAGNYKVKFDFIETVALAPGYKIKDRKISGGYENVRVLEDTGTTISLQHILVVGEGENSMPIKHWRQDWHYEPATVLTFVGRNTWERRDVPADERAGSWSQIVYQVDDAPRYGAVARWTHEAGVSAWEPAAAWRPLPRRDATTRDDYDVVDAVNRHVITPWGWAHEQDNGKLALRGEPQLLVREVATNTYVRNDSFNVAIADKYWEDTGAFWAEIRQAWADLEAQYPRFGLTIQGEPEELYMEILGLAQAVQDGEHTSETATVMAKKVITDYTLTSFASRADSSASR
ncbi:MAG: DUF6607 family protein [Pseudomonadota bacterium]